MKKILSTVLLAIIMSVSACGEKDPQSMAKQVDEILAKDYPMTEEQRVEISELTKQAKNLLDQGKTEDAAQAFDKTLDILKQVEDAAIFNKAD